MASFMTEDLSDELASSPVKLSAVERPGRGQTRNHGGNQQPTHSLLSALIQADFCYAPPRRPAGQSSFTSPPEGR